MKLHRLSRRPDYLIDSLTPRNGPREAELLKNRLTSLTQRRSTRSPLGRRGTFKATLNALGKNRGDIRLAARVRRLMRPGEWGSAPFWDTTPAFSGAKTMNYHDKDKWISTPFYSSGRARNCDGIRRAACAPRWFMMIQSRAGEQRHAGAFCHFGVECV